MNSCRFSRMETLGDFYRTRALLRKHLAGHHRAPCIRSPLACKLPSFTGAHHPCSSTFQTGPCDGPMLPAPVGPVRRVRVSRHAAALEVLRRVTHQATIPIPTSMAEPCTSDGLILRFPALEFRSLLLNAIGRDTFPDRGLWKRHKVALCGLLLQLANGELLDYGTALESVVHQICAEDRDFGATTRQRQGRARARVRTRPNRRGRCSDAAENGGTATVPAATTAGSEDAMGCGSDGVISGEDDAASVTSSASCSVSWGNFIDCGTDAAAGAAAASYWVGGGGGDAKGLEGRRSPPAMPSEPSPLLRSQEPSVVVWLHSQLHAQLQPAAHVKQEAVWAEQTDISAGEAACVQSQDEHQHQHQQHEHQQHQKQNQHLHQGECKSVGCSGAAPPLPCSNSNSNSTNSRSSMAARRISLRARIDAWCRATVGGHSSGLGQTTLMQPVSFGCSSSGCSSRSSGGGGSSAFAILRPLLERVMRMGEPAPLVDIRRNGSQMELQVASLMSGHLPEGWRLICGATILAVDGEAFVNRKRLKGEADLLLVDSDGVVQAVVEVKTAKGNPYVALYDDIGKLLGLLRAVRNRTVTFRHGASSQVLTLDFSKRLRPIYVLGCGGAALGLDMDMKGLGMAAAASAVAAGQGLNGGSRHGGGGAGSGTAAAGVSAVLRSAWSKLMTMELGRELSAAASAPAWSAVKLAALSREAALLQLPASAYPPLARRVAAYFTRLAHCEVYLVDTSKSASGSSSSSGNSGDAVAASSSSSSTTQATGASWSA